MNAIKHALDLDSIPCETGSWRYIPKKKSKEQGAQIDLLFDREDGIINICEIKYSESPFTMTKSDATNLLNKMSCLEKHLPTNKQLFVTLITSSGWKRNIWSEDLIQNEVGLNQLIF